MIFLIQKIFNDIFFIKKIHQWWSILKENTQQQYIFSYRKDINDLFLNKCRQRWISPMGNVFNDFLFQKKTHQHRRNPINGDLFVQKPSTLVFSHGKVINDGLFHKKNSSTVWIHHQRWSFHTKKQHQRIYFLSTIFFSYGKVINVGFFHMEMSSMMDFTISKLINIGKTLSTVIFSYKKTINVYIFLLKRHQQYYFLMEKSSTMSFSYGTVISDDLF